MALSKVRKSKENVRSENRMSQNPVPLEQLRLMDPAHYKFIAKFLRPNDMI